MALMTKFPPPANMAEYRDPFSDSAGTGIVLRTEPEKTTDDFSLEVISATNRLLKRDARPQPIL